MIVLDTDHLSFLQHPGSPEAVALVNKLQRSEEEAVFTTIVSLEEQLRSWLNVIGRYRDPSQQVAYYPRLREFVRFFANWKIADFDLVAAGEFQRLRSLGVRIGNSDLKIAAIAITRRATLLSRNLRDFEKVTGLVVQDWSQ